MKPTSKCTDCGDVVRHKGEAIPQGWSIVEEDLVCAACASLRLLFSVPESWVIADWREAQSS